MNIFLHGTIYGFNTNLAIPALATGNIEFDFSLLPSTSADIIKREVVFGLREPEIEIQVDDTVFSSDTVYTFVLPHQVNQYNNTLKTFYRLMCIIFRINLIVIRANVTKQ